jgi:L-amino acid N-acyltransferase YncA
MSGQPVYELRNARPEDVPAIILVQHLAIQGVPAGFYSQAILDAWDPHPASPEAVERRKARMASGTEIALVAVSPAGEIAGYGSVRQGESELHSIYVDAVHARRGLCRQILRELETRARAADVRELWLHASLPAHPFYEANGYISGERCEHIMPSGIAVPCVHMRKQL